MASPLRSLPSTIDSALGWRHDLAPEVLPTGIRDLNGIIEGCPRGRITEIIGPVSSGRTSMISAVLAEAARLGEISAYIDCSNAFDPVSASAAGIALDRLLLVRCGGSVDHAVRTADLLVHAGGFGVIVLDLCDAPGRDLRRIPISAWYRFRRAIETTPSVLLVAGHEPAAKACASLLVEIRRDRVEFCGTEPFQYLRRARFEARSRKPVRAQAAAWDANVFE